MTNGPSTRSRRRYLQAVGLASLAGLAGCSSLIDQIDNGQDAATVTPVEVPESDPGNGDLQWSFETEDSISSSPTVADGTVYIGSNDNRVYALDATDGTEQWRFETGDTVVSSPVVRDGTVYIGGIDHKIYVLDADDGTERWHFETGASVFTAPAVADGTVYVGSDMFYALDTSDGTEQ